LISSRRLHSFWFFYFQISFINPVNDVIFNISGRGLVDITVLARLIHQVKEETRRKLGLTHSSTDAFIHFTCWNPWQNNTDRIIQTTPIKAPKNVKPTIFS
jgi:hypothetical protein